MRTRRKSQRNDLLAPVQFCFAIFLMARVNFFFCKNSTEISRERGDVGLASATLLTVVRFVSPSGRSIYFLFFQYFTYYLYV